MNPMLFIYLFIVYSHFVGSIVVKLEMRENKTEERCLKSSCLLEIHWYILLLFDVLYLEGSCQNKIKYLWPILLACLSILIFPTNDRFSLMASKWFCSTSSSCLQMIKS